MLLFCKKFFEMVGNIIWNAPVIIAIIALVLLGIILIKFIIQIIKNFFDSKKY